MHSKSTNFTLMVSVILLFCTIHANSQAQPQVPTTLGELNNCDLSFTDLSSDFDISASVPLFTVKASRKNHNVVFNFLKYKDIVVDTNTIRVFVGLQLFLTSYDYSYSGSISPSAIAAAATLGKTKATFDLKIYGLPIDYSKLPKSGSFNADTFAQILTAFDTMVSTLRDTTPISPTVVKLKQSDKYAIFSIANFAGIEGVTAAGTEKAVPGKGFDHQKINALH